MGLDIGELIRQRAARGGRRFLIVPIGFVCDHTEILFDIDVQAAAAARESGVALRRTASLNTSPTFIAALEDLVEEAAGDPRRGRWHRGAVGGVPSCTGRDVPFRLLESGPRAGGVILSEQVDGFTIDAGPDALLIQKPDGIQLCREIGLGDRLVATKPPRLAFIQRGGRLHALPAASVLGIPTRFGPFLRTRLFSWPGKLRMGFEMFVPPRADDADESIGTLIERRFGREAKAYLAEPLLAGIHAGDVDRLSVNALFPRFGAAERKHGSLIKAFRRQRAAPPAGRKPSWTARSCRCPAG